MRQRLTPELKRKILEMAAERGPERSIVSAAVGISPSQLDGYITRHFRDEWQAASESWRRRKEAEAELKLAISKKPVDSILELPVRPFEVPVPVPAVPKEGKPKRAVIIGDSHIPFEDPGSIACFEAVLKASKPDYLVHLGDLLDASELSNKYPHDPLRPGSFQEDLDKARQKLHQWAQLAPGAQRVLVEGNHEDRLTKAIWSLKDASRELAKIDLFRRSFTWPKLLGLDEIGWRWIPYREQPARDVLPKLLVKHGERVSPWAGFTAKREWMAYGRSGISGHTHRATVWAHSDDNGVARWIEAGCTCRYDIPWARDTDWQQCVTVIDWSADLKLMTVEQALIRNGRTLWRGREYGI